MSPQCSGAGRNSTRRCIHIMSSDLKNLKKMFKGLSRKYLIWEGGMSLRSVLSQRLLFFWPKAPTLFGPDQGRCRFHSLWKILRSRFFRPQYFVPLYHPFQVSQIQHLITSSCNNTSSWLIVRASNNLWALWAIVATRLETRQQLLPERNCCDQIGQSIAGSPSHLLETYNSTGRVLKR